MNCPSLELPLSAFQEIAYPSAERTAPRVQYSPPWANTSIIGVAGSSGSGKTSLSMAIIRELSLPWVVILSMDSFYRPLTPEQSAAAFRNEYDFDSPDAIDFEKLVENLRDIKAGYVDEFCGTSLSDVSQKKSRYPRVLVREARPSE
jgi:uridine kinase